MIKKEFTIKKNAELPVLSIELKQDDTDIWGDYYNQLSGATITFSMVDTETGQYKITNKSATIVEKPTDIELERDPEYLLAYKFKAKDTNKIGRYRAEFKIVFADSETSTVTGTFIAPVLNDLYINVIPSLF